MKDFQQSDKGGMAKSQLTTLLWFLWIWYASRKSSSGTRLFNYWTLEQELLNRIIKTGIIRTELLNI